LPSHEMVLVRGIGPNDFFLTKEASCH